MGSFKEQYENAKKDLLNDSSICIENKDWMKKVLSYQETKGKRSNGIPTLDESCYKTLLSYLQKLKNINKWFGNKPLKNITEADFRKVYEDLEEGRITTKSGEIYKDRISYYKKVFKSKPFEIIGKDKLAREVIEYNVIKEIDVRFIPDFRNALKEIVQNAILPEHKLFIQLYGDYAENLFSILQFEKKDFEEIMDKETNEPSFILNLHKGIIKRSRTPRREYNIFPETYLMLKKYLEDLKPTDKLFNFGLRQAEKMFSRAVEKAGIKLQDGKKPTLKDLRSSLACSLLNEEWTTDEIKARLGHKPSSKVLDVYVTYSALNKSKIKKRIYQGTLEDVKEEFERYKERSKKDLTLSKEKFEETQKEMANMKEGLKYLTKIISKIYREDISVIDVSPTEMKKITSSLK